ncbi:MAG: TIGR04149 family rSAM-modified RiPP [Bacteroidaceae bacterium]
MKIKRLKLNALSAEGLRQKEMDAIIGGEFVCGCGCLFEGTPGGATTADNGEANKNSNLWSEYNKYVYDPETGWEYSYGVPKDSDF